MTVSDRVLWPGFCVGGCLHCVCNLIVYRIHFTNLSCRPEQMTREVWDYIFFGGEYPLTEIPRQSLELALGGCILKQYMFFTHPLSFPVPWEGNSATGIHWTCVFLERTSFPITWPTSSTIMRPFGLSLLAVRRSQKRDSFVCGPRLCEVMAISCSILRRLVSSVQPTLCSSTYHSLGNFGF